MSDLIGRASRRCALALFLLFGPTVSRAMVAQQGQGTRAASAAASTIVLDGATVVDVEHGTVAPGQRVVITGHRIQAVGPASRVTMPARARIIDARGKYVIPGLWDMHTHPVELAPRIYYPLFLANGITGIRDAWSSVPLDTLRWWRREILLGTRVGPPRQLLSGAAIDEAEKCTRPDGADLTNHVCFVAGDTSDLRTLITQLRAAGADILKTYHLSETNYIALAAEARRQGIPFGGHVQMPPLIASDHGASIVDHETGTRDCEHLLPPGVGSEAEGMSSLLALGTRKRSQNDSSLGTSFAGCLQAAAQRFRQNGTWFVPTRLVIWFIRKQKRRFGDADTTLPAMAEPFLQHFTARMADFWAGVPLRGNWLRDSASASHVAGGPADSLDGLALARRFGLPLLAGTDEMPTYLRALPPGFSLHGELAAYVKEGLTPLEALQTVTLNPAKMLHGTDSLGTVAAGKLADLVLLDANPLDDITNTTTIRAVVANGRYYDRTILDRILNETRRYAGSVPAQALAGEHSITVLPTTTVYAWPELAGTRYERYSDFDYWKHAPAAEGAWVDSTIGATLVRQKPRISWTLPPKVRELAKAGKAADPASYQEEWSDASNYQPSVRMRAELGKLVTAVGGSTVLVPVQVSLYRRPDIPTDRVCADLFLQLIDGATGLVLWRNYMLSRGDMLMRDPIATGCGATAAAALAVAVAVAFPREGSAP